MNASSGLLKASRFLPDPSELRPASAGRASPEHDREADHENRHGEGQTGSLALDGVTWCSFVCRNQGAERSGGESEPLGLGDEARRPGGQFVVVTGAVGDDGATTASKIEEALVAQYLIRAQHRVHVDVERLASSRAAGSRSPRLSIHR